jgi:N-acetylneuraminic acid mutarotase
MVSAPIARADYGEWTWISGSDSLLQAGTYGTKGVPAATNVPGARYGSAAWTDSTGNFWLFGGYGLGSTATEKVKNIEDLQDYLNDLWRYDPDTNTWIWMSGSDMILQAGIYGTKGVPAAANVPGGRYGSVSWTDSNGDVWLFGGYGLDSTGTDNYLNDLWRYDPDTDIWTWMSGSDIAEQPGIYGTQGVPSADNVPGARYESVAWTDSTGDLWLFGGFGLDSVDKDRLLNDLWRYDPDNATWTWINGDDKGAKKGTYGTQGVPAADNVPGARFGSVAWTDSTGDMCFFGGYGYDKNNLYYISDLWCYDPDTALWVWMGGPDKVAKKGKYGEQGMISEDSVPGARYDGVAWVDLVGDLWLFGGFGKASSGRVNSLNDLWRYYPNTDLWTWISGSDKTSKQGTYGTKGVPAVANVPGSRNGSVAWTDSDGNLWLFGGYVYNKKIKRNDYMNDLWRFELPADIN